MDASRLNPELRTTYRLFPSPPIGRPWGIPAIRAAQRLVPKAKLPDGVRLETLRFPAGGGMRIFTPISGGTGAALVFIHGGGMVIGAASQDDPRVALLSRDLDIVTVSVDYRLAPENPFPIPVDDCLAAWDWLQENAAARGIDPARVAVGGQSAGGGLAAALAQRVRDQREIQPVAQWLFCPMLDDRTAANRQLDQVKHFLWNNRSNLVGWGAYLATAPGAANLPDYAAPARRENLEGLPPAWIGVGDIELFYDEDRRYAERLTAGGVECTFDVVAGAPHAFESLAPRAEISKKYYQGALAWLAKQLSVPLR